MFHYLSLGAIAIRLWILERRTPKSFSIFPVCLIASDYTSIQKLQIKPVHSIFATRHLSYCHTIMTKSPRSTTSTYCLQKLRIYNSWHRNQEDGYSWKCSTLKIPESTRFFCEPSPGLWDSEPRTDSTSRKVSRTTSAAAAASTSKRPCEIRLAPPRGLPVDPRS